MGFLIIPFALFDIAVGLGLIFPELYGEFLLTLATIALVKGSISVLGSLLAGFFFDYMGWMDLLAGLSLLFGFGIPFFWILMMLKGVMCFFMGL